MADLVVVDQTPEFVLVDNCNVRLDFSNCVSFHTGFRLIFKLLLVTSEAPFTHLSFTLIVQLTSLDVLNSVIRKSHKIVLC